MGLNHPYQGENFTGAYAISATPFVTSSTISLGEIKEIRFGHVSKFIVVRNTSPSSATSAVAVGFTRLGLVPANSNYFILSGSEAFSGDLRTDRIFLSGSVGATSTFSVVCGLTTIPSRNLTTITGSNGFGGVG
jgi:hypothetical protein